MWKKLKLGQQTLTQQSEKISVGNGSQSNNDEEIEDDI